MRTHLKGELKPRWSGIHPQACVSPTATIGEGVAIYPFVYVGDGISDCCVSLAAERRFARRALAAWLDEQGVAYETFGDLHDVASGLGLVPGQGTEPATVEGDDRRRRDTA